MIVLTAVIFGLLTVYSIKSRHMDWDCTLIQWARYDCIGWTLAILFGFLTCLCNQILTVGLRLYLDLIGEI
jgi:hypothetical protein